MMDGPAHPIPTDACADGALVAGPRVHLRHPRATDRRAWVDLRRQSRAFLEPWEPLPPAGVDPFGDSGFHAYLADADRLQTQRHVIVRTEDAALLGHVGLNQIAGGVFQNAALGYWIGEPHARSGYMSEAIGLALERAFDQLDLHRVEANLIPRNEASRRTVRRCGLEK